MMTIIMMMMQVTISNDEELIIALTEMPGPLYKLSLNLKGNKKPTVIAETSEAEDKKAVHYGVTCDGCDMCPITGVRYKSLELDDYDLCSVCEAKGVHPGQNMIKITEPGYTFPQRLFKRMQVLQERAKNKEERASKKMEEKHEKTEEKDEKKEANKAEKAQPRFGPPGPLRGCGRRGRGGLFGPFGNLHGGMGMGQGGAWAAAAPAFEAMMKVMCTFSHPFLSHVFFRRRDGPGPGLRAGLSTLSSTPRPWRRP